MGDEKVAEYEQISDQDADVAEVASDWPQDVELGAVNPDEADDPQQTPVDEGDKTSAIVFDDTADADDAEDEGDDDEVVF